MGGGGSGTAYVPGVSPQWPHVPTPSHSNENSQRPGKQAVPRWMYLGANTGMSQGVVPQVKEEGVRRTVCLIVAGPLQDPASDGALGFCAAVCPPLRPHRRSRQEKCLIQHETLFKHTVHKTTGQWRNINFILCTISVGFHLPNIGNA